MMNGDRWRRVIGKRVYQRARAKKWRRNSVGGGKSLGSVKMVRQGRINIGAGDVRALRTSFCAIASGQRGRPLPLRISRRAIGKLYEELSGE